MTDSTPRRDSTDLVASILLLVVLVTAALIASTFGLFLGFASDACGTGTCDYALLNAGGALALFGPLVVGVAGLVVTIVRLVRRRRAYWVPLAAIITIAAVWWSGFGVVELAVQGSVS